MYSARQGTKRGRRDRVPRVAPGSDAGGQGDDAGATQRRDRGVGHGFRSSFKDWARERDVDETLSEFALAHVEGSATVAAYARDDLLEKRRPVMQDWGDACMEPGDDLKTVSDGG